MQTLHPCFAKDVAGVVRDNALGAVARMLASLDTERFPLEQVVFSHIDRDICPEHNS